MPQPHGKQTEHDRKPDVSSRPQPIAVACEDEGLQAEGRECRIAAADSDHDELPDRRADQKATVGTGDRAEETDDEGSRDIDDQRTPGKGLAEMARHEARQPVAPAASEGAADHDPKISLENHPLLLPFQSPEGAAWNIVGG